MPTHLASTKAFLEAEANFAYEEDGNNNNNDQSDMQIDDVNLEVDHQLLDKINGADILEECELGDKANIYPSTAGTEKSEG